jgi:hypothetical protein
MSVNGPLTEPLSEREIILNLDSEVREIHNRVEAIDRKIDKHDLILLGDEDSAGLLEQMRGVKTLGKIAVGLLGFIAVAFAGQVGLFWWQNAAEAGDRLQQRLAMERAAASDEEVKDRLMELTNAAQAERP